MPVDLTRQLLFLMVLAIPIASIAWNVTYEDVFREPREWWFPEARIAAGLSSGNSSIFSRASIASALRHGCLLAYQAL
jgi:hypothetical protein